MLICRNCQQWEVSQADSFCSWCGESLVSIAVTHPVIPFYPEGIGEQLVGILSLRNSGTHPAKVHVRPPAGFIVDATELELDVRADEVDVPFQFSAPVSANWSAAFTVEVEGGKPVTATVVCSVTPKFQIESGGLALARGERGPFPVTLRHIDGGPAFVTRVTALGGRLEVLEGSGMVQPGGDLTAMVQLPGGARADREMFKETLSLELLDGQSLTRTEEVPMNVTVQMPPRLEVSTDLLDFGDVMPKRSRRKYLELWNRGEGMLIIRQVALLDNDGSWQIDLPANFTKEVPGNTPLSIPVILKEGQGGIHRARLVLSTNDTEQPERAVELQGRVLTDPAVFAGYVGIDFGTTHSCISVARPGKHVEPLELDDMGATPEERVAMPSCVYWPKAPQPGNLRDCIVGREAQRLAMYPDNEDAVALSIKRQLGSQEATRYMGVPLKPQEVAARIIRHMVDKAEDYLGAVVANAVVTVPANFTPPQVRATVEACELAGLNADVVRKNMMDEPVGAAVDYLTELSEYQLAAMGLGDDFYALIYDFGGGTLDVSIIRYRYDGHKRSLRVVATKGDNFMGGDDLTEMLRVHLKNKLESEIGSRLPADPPRLRTGVSNAKLRAAHSVNFVLLRGVAEAVKRQLSIADEVKDQRVELGFLSGTEINPQYVEVRVTKREYEKLIRDRLESSWALVDRALQSARLKTADISLILLVGMSSRTPLVSRLMENWFGRTPVLHPQPKACVARGAFKKGEMLANPALEVTELVRELDQTNCRYGILASTWRGPQFRMAIPEGVRFPATGSYPPAGMVLRTRPGIPLIVALNRGENDDPRDNEEIAPLGEIQVESDEPDEVPLQVFMEVTDHRTVHVKLLVNGVEARQAHFEEY